MAKSMCGRSYLLWIFFSAALVNVIALIYLTLKTPDAPVTVTCTDPKSVGNIPKDAAPSDVTSNHSLFTFILREFEDFGNDVANTTTLLLSKSDAKSMILIVSDSFVYPPLALPKSEKVRVVTLRGSVDKPVLLHRPEVYIAKSEFVFVFPDGVRFDSNLSLKQALRFFLFRRKLTPTITMAVWPLNRISTQCVKLDVDLKRWTASYESLSNSSVCDAVVGSQFVLLTTAESLLGLPYPYLRPLQPTIFIQNALQNQKVAVDWENNLFYQSANVFETDAHKLWKHKTKEETRLREAFSLLGIKLVRHATGSDAWYGCRKDTARCFGTVINDMPEYIYQNRWTPPCCLRVLRMTVQHVFKILADQGVRFWLEGGSLLGAVRHNDIIPWDYDVDIGIYRDDIVKSQQLVNSQSEAYEDDEGFIWEKAVEGEFFRVQYSQKNHLHVDIFPFHSVNGTMTKSTWFKTHRQDREFPETFLTPLEKIRFAGIEAPTPNNIREFLEFKFGPGVIENPKYPNAQAV